MPCNDDKEEVKEEGQEEEAGKKNTPASNKERKFLCTEKYVAIGRSRKESSRGIAHSCTNNHFLHENWRTLLCLFPPDFFISRIEDDL